MYSKFLLIFWYTLHYVVHWSKRFWSVLLFHAGHILSIFKIFLFLCSLGSDAPCHSTFPPSPLSVIVIFIWFSLLFECLATSLTTLVVFHQTKSKELVTHVDIRAASSALWSGYKLTTHILLGNSYTSGNHDPQDPTTHASETLAAGGTSLMIWGVVFPCFALYNSFLPAYIQLTFRVAKH